MAKIELLDQITIDKIAAGEVVERPSSVVKELCENAIDAGANKISVEIKDGGRELIRVTDNGSGFEKDSVRTAFLRHATSKIRDIADLLQISSLGFRGEALSSICAVSQVTLMTKTSHEMTGVRYKIEGGKEIAFEEAGLPDGSTILIENLFYNTPARRKFLKTAKTESSYIESLIDHLALSHPDISFRFLANGKAKLETSGNGELLDVIYQIYGRELTKNLVKIDVESNSYHLYGYIGKPMIARGNRSYESFFVNGRFIQDKILSKAIEEAYNNYLMMHQFPFAILFLELPGHLVDVNVHPAKANVRFSEEETVYTFAKEAVADALAHRELIPEMEATDRGVTPSGSLTSVSYEAKQTTSVASTSNAHSPKSPEPFEANYHKTLSAPANVSIVSDEVRQRTVAETELPIIYTDIEPETAKKAEGTDAGIVPESLRAPQRQIHMQMEIEVDPLEKAHFRLIGEVLHTYWLIEYNYKLYMVDQHAAHEKVNYERFLKKYHEKSFMSQRIMPPHIVTLSPEEADLIAQFPEILKGFGFEIEPFGGMEYAISSVPADLYGMSEKEFFRALLDEFTTYPVKDRDPDLLLRKIATASCKASVKGGDNIGFAQADALLKELFRLENPYNCPHGRPTMISFSKYEIEKMFKRVVT